MPKNKYVKREIEYNMVIGGRYLDDSASVEMLISTMRDGNMARLYSKDALDNYQIFLEKYFISSLESFSPALGLNYRIITIDGSNEERFTGQFAENGDSRNEYHCDAVIVCDTSIPVAFRVGDCPVVLIIGEAPVDIKIMALVHAGRAELTAGILKKTVGQMIEKHQMHILSTTAYVFPHICRNCYALEHVEPVVLEQAKDFLENVDDLYHLDLLEWLTAQLEEAGIRRLVKAHYRCTAGVSQSCVSAELHKSKNFKGLFSHYRAVHRKELEGRFVIVARIIDKDYEDEEKIMKT